MVMHSDGARSIRLSVNGDPVEVTASAATPLLYILRNDLQLNGPKFGCGLGECGACCVLIDGKLARSCIVPMGGVEGHAVTTLEGLGSRDDPGPVQRAFIEEQAAQCGYCLNGMILTTQALLSVNPDPDDDQISQALRFNLCRCGTHVEIMKAVRCAARKLRNPQ